MSSCQVFRNNAGQIDRVEAPNGKESKLYKDMLSIQPDPEVALKLWAQVYTDSFKAWFGDWEKKEGSKVVDENGEPLLVYHGSDNYGFKSFDKELLGSNTNAPSARKGFFFASNRTASRKYLGVAISQELREQLNYNYEYSLPDSDISQAEVDASDYWERKEEMYRQEVKSDELYRLWEAEQALEQGYIDEEQFDLHLLKIV
jgi:hypothetical protein